MLRLPVIYLEPPLGAVGFPGGVVSRDFVNALDKESVDRLNLFWKWSSELKGKVSNKLRSLYPDVEFAEYSVKYVEDLRDVLEREKEAIGYLVFDLQSGGDLIRQLINAGKPMIVINEALGGGADVLLGHGGYSMSVSETEYLHFASSLDNYPILMFSSRHVDSEDLLSRVKYFKVLDMLRNTHALVIIPKGKAIWDIINSVSSVTGIKFSVIYGQDFVDKYYSKVTDDEAKPIAEKWIKEAAQFPESDKQYNEVLKSAKLYIAMNRALEDYKANAISIDCLGLRLINKVLLDAWPCLGYMQLWLDGKYVPMCEADIQSLVVALISKYLLNEAASATDPVVDELTNEIIYYHCYLPINPLPNLRLKYSIIPAHAGTRYAAVNVEYPVGQEVTAVGMDFITKTMYIHTATITGNELSLMACGTKVIAKGNVQALKSKWGGGWHRVVVLGNHKQP